MTDGAVRPPLPASRALAYNFAAVRRDVRAFVAESEAGRDVEELVVELLA